MKKSINIFLDAVAAFLLLTLPFPFPVEAFEFPVNAAVLLAAIAGLWVLHREKPDCGLSRWLGSGKTSIGLIAALLVATLIMGLVPQLPAADYLNRADGGYRPGIFGIWDIIHTWWFIAIVMALMANLLTVIFKHASSPRFLLNHLGLFLALAGGFFGAADMSTSRAMVYRDSASNQAFTRDGKAETLPYEMTLQDFEEELDGNGSVQNYRAQVAVDGRTVEIRVNHPYRRTAFEDIYIVGYDRENSPSRYCILEIVRQPWKYVIWAGIVMMLAGCVLLFAQGSGRKKEGNI